MDLEEFKTTLIRPHNRNFTVRGSWGVYDVYKYIRKHGWYNIGRPLTEKEFYSIIRSVNTLLAKEISLGREVVLPSRMGKLELRKYLRGVSIVNNHVKNTYPIDWNETLKLWYKDAEAMKSKTLIRMESKEVFSVKYNKHKATYANKLFYSFCLNSFIKRALKVNIKKGIVDTIW